MTDRSPHHCSFAYALSACVVASFAILVSLGSTARASGQELLVRGEERLIMGERGRVIRPGHVSGAEHRGDSISGARRLVGERFYRRGILASGLPAEALLADGSMVPATGLPCVSCHQRSGFGSSEGGVSPPPITWLSLTLPRDPDVRSPYLSRSREGEARPGYDADRFALAVRNGIDPSGRRLDAVMPRYDVDDETLAALIRHLEGLTPHAVPGIDEEEIHFATVIGPAVPADLERQMLSVLDGFAGAKNAESRNETARARRGVFYQDTRNEAHRRWVIHPWRLHGSPESWPAQLELLLQQRPVFALISGLTRDTYSPVDGFCLRHSIPCILPNSDLPPDDPSEGQTIWISHGFRQEASLLVSDLRAAQIPTGASIEVI